MLGTIMNGLLETQVNLTLLAGAVCALMAVTLVLLMRNVEMAARPQGWTAVGWIALVAGVGVWATHFVAMIGYRPDTVLTYGPGTTALSALLGVLFVGLPIAAATRTRRTRRLAGLGVQAGVGVAIMHLTGMAAIENCLKTYDPIVLGFGLVTGCAAFAYALTRTAPGWKAQAARGLGIVTGVCALHFIAMSSVTLDVLGTASRGIGTSVLSSIVAGVSILVFGIAIKATAIQRRLVRERRAAEEITARRLSAFATALQNMSNGLVMVDARNVITAINGRVFDLFEARRGEIDEGSPLRDLMDHIGRGQGWSEEVVTAKFAHYLEGLAHGATVSREEVLSDGRTLLVSCRRAEAGGAVITFDDVTALWAAQAEITRLAHNDPLTGLLNRRSFREHVQEGGAQPVAALLLDLDHFKSVNDTLGHPAGDSLLRQVAERICKVVDGRGTVFRLGGDEIVVLMRGVHADAAGPVAEEIVYRLGTPFDLGVRMLTIGCSIGMYLSEGPEDASAILQKADLALYRAKNNGRSRVEVYEDGMQQEARLRQQVKIDLGAGLAQGQFFLNYQPLFRLPARNVVGFEALIRWDHPELGRVNPADFVPIAEETGLILEIGAWVLDEACRQLSEWPNHLHMSVNVSPVQMREPEIVGAVRAALSRHGIAPERLTLEVTETAIMMDGRALARNIAELRAMGVKISMDDFGTGYSSLTHLREFELDEIKIDRSFVASETNDQGAMAVTEAVTGMARSLSIGTVGEGVETEAHLERLTQLGCQIAQGYFLSRPLSAVDATALLGRSGDNVDRSLAFGRMAG